MTVGVVGVVCCWTVPPHPLLDLTTSEQGSPEKPNTKDITRYTFVFCGVFCFEGGGGVRILTTVSHPKAW